MCGIAGFSLVPDHRFDAEAFARVLLAGIAERGRDATGWAYRTPNSHITVHKDSKPLAEMIEHIDIPHDATEVILHVREYTKGIPGINDNNHPVRWGRVVGVHNGHLENDDALFEQFGAQRSTPQISVDSEAIMMLTDTLDCAGRALETVRGSAAVALLHDERPGHVTLARRTRRPLVLGVFADGLLFASTREAIELVARGARLDVDYEDVTDGTVIEVRAGREVERRRFSVDYRYPGTKLTPYPPLAAKDRLVHYALAGLDADDAPAPKTPRARRAVRYRAAPQSP
jgi:glucosamine 6-phosphate synthetase-like amidotransferase/phosphosugar isomerase protein